MLGIQAERLAALLLRLKGFRIVARRYRTPLGEIDLIARRGNLVLIVEVKARATLVDAMAAVSMHHMRRMEASADLWLQRQPDHAQLSLRFDLIAILPWQLPRHITAFFTARR